jgi:hypothetical protein
MRPTKPKLRPAEGWPEGWYYSGEVETVNLEAMLDPDGFFNRVILGRDVKDRQPASEARPPDLASARPPASKA